MSHRDEQLLQLRPVIDRLQTPAQMSEEEVFQNNTLRPILKLQNDLLMAVFEQHLVERKVNVSQWNKEKGEVYIHQAMQKDLPLRLVVQGLVIGQFTSEEWGVYAANKKALGKRLIGMAIQRLQSQVEGLMAK